MNSKRPLNETDLFKSLNVFLLSRDRNQLKVLKDKTSLLANVKIDNSAFIRGMINYFYENQEELEKLVPYAVQTKGFNILAKFNQMLAENRTPEEIEQELGIDIQVVNKLTQQHKNSQ